MSFIAQLGQQMAQGAAGGILGMAFGGYNDARQLRQQEKLQRLQIEGQKQLTDYSYGKQLEMWKNTSYPAQVEMLKKAGLNPGLLYGMGGGGGTTTGAGGTTAVSGGNAPTGGGELTGGMAMMLQARMMQAQIDNINADTANKQAENPNIPKTGKEIEARTLNFLQDIKNKEAQEALTKTQNRIFETDAKIKEATKEDAIDMIQWVALKTKEELHQASNQTYISQATKFTIIDTMKANLIGSLLQNKNIAKETELKTASIEKIQADIKQGWTKLGIDEKNMLIKAWETEINASQPGLWNVIGGLLKSAVSHLDEITKPGTIEKRYDNPSNN